MGVVVVLSSGVSYVFDFVNSFLIKSLICATKKILLIDVEKKSKILQKFS